MTTNDDVPETADAGLAPETIAIRAGRSANAQAAHEAHACRSARN